MTHEVKGEQVTAHTVIESGVAEDEFPLREG